MNAIEFKTMIFFLFFCMFVRANLRNGLFDLNAVLTMRCGLLYLIFSVCCISINLQIQKLS